MIKAIKLNKKEQALHDCITWDLSRGRSDEAVRLDLERMGQLAQSLLKRKAIPQVRLDWFTKPEMNIGGRGKSREQVFESNGTSGKDILCHPNFMSHLKYFIHGPSLPNATIQGFCKIIEEDRGTSGMVLDQIRAFVRREVRNMSLSPHDAGEEFCKLAFEIGRGDLADSVRSAAKQVKK